MAQRVKALAKKTGDMPRYIVQRDPQSARFPFIVLDSASGESALWKPNTKVGSVAQRFRSASLAQAAADQLNATHENN